MINKYPQARNIFAEFRDVLKYLFIPGTESKYTKILLGVFTLIAVILRLYIIDNPIGYDEAYTFINFSSKPFKFILADYHAPNNHILNSLLIGIIYRILGNHTWIVRVPAFVVGVLSVPASFIAARRFFTTEQSLAASAVLAVAPNIVAASANGRGYTLVIFFSLLLMNFAGILVKEQKWQTLAAYAITGALGFYSIPIFLYPMAGFSLWVMFIYLYKESSWQNKWINLRNFLLACIVSGLLTLLLYSPVIIFGTGLKSIIDNDIVKSQSWIDFGDNILTRSTLTWQSWMKPLTPVIQYIFLTGFVFSIILYHKISNQKLPMQVFIVLGTCIMLVLQRVAPLPRIWGYLEMFYFLFSAVGLVGIGQLILQKKLKDSTQQIVLANIVLLTVLTIFTNISLGTQNRQARLNRTIAPEKFAADYLTQNLTDKDTIVAVAPSDIQTAYYLKINGVPYEYFYQRDHPVNIQNTLIMVRTRGEYDINTLEKVLDYFNLTPKLNQNESRKVFEYGPLLIYSIPAK